MKAKCQSRNTCKVCNKQHHTLLHIYVNDNQTFVQSEQNQTTKTLHTQTSQSHYGTLFGTAQVLAFNEFGTSIVIRALIDPCSEDNFILSSTTNTLNLDRYYKPSIIEVIGKTKAEKCSDRVQLTLSSTDKQFYLKISAGVVDSLTSNLPSVAMPEEVFGFINNLPIADPMFNKLGSIQLLLGIGFYTSIRLEELKRFGNHLIAENTLLGYIIRGTAPVSKGDRPRKIFMTQSTAIELNQNIKNFWEV